MKNSLAQLTISKCGTTHEERRTAITATLETVSDPALLITQGTPQNTALEWIVELDTLCVCPDDDNLVQRYVLAVFYYSMGGGTWNQCNAPANFADTSSIADADASCFTIGNGLDMFQEETFNGNNAWLTPSDECYWGGVACLSATHRLDRIEFENDGLSGILPSELQSLTELRFLILEEGHIEGTIPTELGSLEKLHVLDLNFNRLIGTIPTEIYNINYLFELDLNDNFLSGTIATEIGKLRFLRFLQLDFNILSGTIPSEIGNMESLQAQY
eukprot:6622162-Ditylum_brightwellii.AAC.1